MKIQAYMRTRKLVQKGRTMRTSSALRQRAGALRPIQNATGYAKTRGNAGRRRLAKRGRTRRRGGAGRQRGGPGRQIKTAPGYEKTRRGGVGARPGPGRGRRRER